MNLTTLLQKNSILIFLIASFFGNLYSQVNWDKYENNPILNVGDPGTWESNLSGPTSVIYHDGIYEAWLFGTDDEGTGRIGYASSSDGIIWDKYENNPVLVPGNQGEWDDTNTDHACVLLIDGTYKMWYMGEDESSARIGYATSTDGLNWEKYNGNPVLNLGTAGTWDENEVMHPSVVFDGSTYHMWYNGYGQDVQRTGYATSPDGINWTKYSGNPVLTIGDPGVWDDYMLALMRVIYKDNEFKIWYTAGDGTDGSSKYFRIGYATSPDGITWSKSENNPVLDKGEVGAWDSLGVVTSTVIFDTTGKIYKMWYGGLDGSYGGTGYAISDPVANLNSDIYMIIPNHFSLMQNYPNPFNPKTTIIYTITKPQEIKLIIYDILGNEIKVLFDGFQNKGAHSVPFMADDLSSGVYFYKLQNDKGESISKKMLLIK
jgi:predicted GH43/DUF377 family glycosyl hydrolase